MNAQGVIHLEGLALPLPKRKPADRTYVELTKDQIIKDQAKSINWLKCLVFFLAMLVLITVAFGAATWIELQMLVHG